MPSFSDEYRKERQDRSRKQVEAGGLPVDAEWRLTHLRDNPRLFTGNLSVNELALTVSVGIQPMGQVMGASTYKVGWQFTVPYFSHELDVLTTAHSTARSLAIGRMQQEAKLLGADGVIGVRLDRRNNQDQAGLIEYQAFGTAVRLEGPSRWDTPFVAAVSVQELWGLIRSGHFPIGFVFGGCVWYQVSSVTTQYLQGNLNVGGLGGYRNVELVDYSQAVYQARRGAMNKVEYEASMLGADGIVGMQVETNTETREVEVNEMHRRDLIVHFTAFGTAIMPCASIPYSVEYVVPIGG